MNNKANAAAIPGGFTRCLIGVLACALGAGAGAGCTKKKSQEGAGEGASGTAPAKLVKQDDLTG